MSSRRQASTTSLARYARAPSPDSADRSLDFCNAFWGADDAGVDVLFARMRGAIRTMEELKNFWKERAMIEEQYAKRLGSLAKFTLGRDEIGELRGSLETLRLETDKQATFHLSVAQQIKNELEAPTNALLNRQLHHKKNYQSAIEREFKLKQQQQSHVSRAREKYESDCTRINSFTAQATIIQGRELEKIQTKLERAQQTVGANEQDFQKFTRILQDTTVKWEQDWKEFCDRCQDIEEERMEYMKDNMWAYANLVSTVCVSDDESCERVRLSLESFEPEKDMENFVYTYGTGNTIPNPPMFVNYAKPEAIPPNAQRPGSRPANFQRVTERTREFFIPPQAPEEEPDLQQNSAGIGAGGGRNEHPPANQSRPVSRASSRVPAPGQGGMNGTSAPNGKTGMSLPADPNAEPIAANERLMLKVGDRAYPVDLSNNPQDRSVGAANVGGGPPRVGQDDDPLARQMAELRNAASSAGSIRRNQPPDQQQQTRPPHQTRDSISQLSPPPGGRGGGPPNKMDYRRSAEFVVGGPPPGGSSRPASPNPPTAVLAMPPPTVPQPDQAIQNVLTDYGQSFPGERKSVSRPGSRAGSFSGPNPIQQQGPQSGQGRPMSSGSMAGVGARGRSPSPQPFRPPSRAASPMQQPQQRGVSPAAARNNNISPAVQPAQLPQNPPQPYNTKRNSMRAPPGAGAIPTPLAQTNGGLSGPGHTSRQSSISQRPVSPNPVGIAIGRDGRVVEDELADRFANMRGPQPPIGAPPPQQGFSHPGQQPPPQRTPSYPPPTQAPPQHPYGAPPPAPTPGYGQQQYAQPAPPQPVPPPPQQPQNYGQPYQGYGQPPIPDYNHANGPTRSQSVSMGQQQQPQGGYYSNGAVQPYAQSYGVPNQNAMRPPSPQPPASQQPQTSPTGAFTDNGSPILFYVTALYDYQAVIEEEFDFQTGDVIAVTATPEDGWWSGELLDEARKQPGRHVFPSNFVRLL